MTNLSSQPPIVATDDDISQDFPPFPIGRNTLSEKQRLAAEMLAAGRGYQETAQAAGVDRRTIYNWRQDELFQEAIEHRRRELFGQATDRVRALLNPAIDVMEAHLKDRYDRSRFRAAAALLRLAGLHKTVRVE